MDVTRMLNAALPPGLEISTVEEVELRSPALETQLKSAEYRVTFQRAGRPGPSLKRK